MTTNPVPTGPIETEPRGFVPGPEQLEQLLATLSDAGVELGDYDRLIVEWLTTSPGWEWSTVATIASWVKRAAAETEQLRAERDKAIEHRDHWHGEAMSATTRIAELEPPANA
jgi:hypothetical protein